MRTGGQFETTEKVPPVFFPEKTALRYTYNPAGGLAKVEDLKNSNNVLETYTYDNSLRPATYREGKALTSYTYDYYDRVLTEIVKDAANTSKILSKKSYTYILNNTGWFTTETVYGDTTAENVVSSYQNNIMGQTVNKNIAGNITSYTYDFVGNILTEANKITDTVSLSANRTYNHNKQVLSEQIVDPNGETTAVSFTYDMLGRMTSSTDAKNNTTNYQYYSTDKVVKKSYPIGTGSEYADINYIYDAAGNLVQESDGITNTAYTYDFKNRLIKEQRGNQYTTYTYDLLDNLLEICNANNAATTYTYDQLNRCKTIKDALGKTETFTYNNYGDIISKKDRNGNTITYTSDALHRNLTTTYGTSTITNTYNLNGNIKSEQLGNASKQYTYNSKGLLAVDKTKIGSKEFSIQKQYDNRGNYTNVKYLSGSSVVHDMNYVWDNRNRMKVVSLKNNGTNNYSEIERYSYDANNNLTTKTTDNGITATYVYDRANRVTSLSNKKGSSVVSAYNYTYFANGFVSSETDNTGVSSEYTYNTAGNLVKEVSKLNGSVKQSKAYSYDVAGNRSGVTATGENSYTQYYTYDNNNRITGEATVPNGNNNVVMHTYTYDNNGNRTSVEKMTVTLTDYHAKLGIYEDSDISVASKDYYKYNELNQLTSVSSIGDSRNYRYAYLPNGLRYYKTDGTHYDYMYYDGDQICARAANAENAFTHYYVFGLDRIKDNYNNHYIYNGHGDVTMLTNASGAVTRNYDYDAFGVENNKKTSDLNPFRYCGEYYDTETGNIYLRARYYDPSVGGFITEDPVRDGANWYSYCGGNPVSYKDPSGSMAKSDIAYSGDVKLQLLEYTIEYLDAKISGDSQAMTEAQSAANALRAKSKKYSNSGLGDEFSNYMNMFIAAGFAAADASGYVYGSDEYAIVATTAMSTYVNKYKEIDRNHQMRLLALGAYYTLKTNDVAPWESSNVYYGKRDLSADFKGGKTLNRHYNDHGKEMGYRNQNAYLNGARNFFAKKPTGTTQSFVSKGGTYFRYDTKTNEFGIINEHGGISTYYLPDEGIKYWMDQIDKYK